MFFPDAGVTFRLKGSFSKIYLLSQYSSFDGSPRLLRGLPYFVTYKPTMKDCWCPVILSDSVLKVNWRPSPHSCDLRCSSSVTSRLLSNEHRSSSLNLEGILFPGKLVSAFSFEAAKLFLNVNPLTLFIRFRPLPPSLLDVPFKRPRYSQPVFF